MCQFILFFKHFFFSVEHFKSLYWICYNTASVLCFGFLNSKYMGSLLPEPGIEASSHALEG